jgi:hypothetical protein
VSTLAPSSQCLNCGATLTGPYCAQCGQHLTGTDLSLRDLLRETTHELTHVDGKVLRTLKALFFKPGQLTIDFLAGRRARWLTPLRIYLICSVVYFVSGPLIERVTHRSVREMARFQLTDESGRPVTVLTPELRRQVAQGLPGRIYGVEAIERAVQNPARLNQQITSAFQQAMFVLLPLFAFLTWLVWRRPQQHYPAHLYLALHLHAAWFGILTVVNAIGAFLAVPAGAVVGALAAGGVAIYSLVAIRRVFGGTWPGTIARSLVVLIVYLVCLGAAGLLLLGLALFAM